MSVLIHPSAIISPLATLEDNVEIGPFTVIHENVYLSSGCRIGAYCELGLPSPLAAEKELKFGKNCNIRSHNVFYSGSKIGDSLNTGHYVSVRENSIIGDGCQLGNRSDVQGDCVIGNYTKCHADVHIGKMSRIGNYVWLFPEVLLTNDPTPPSTDLIGVTIDDFAVLAAKVLVLPGVSIGKDCVVAAGSVVKENIPEGKLASGNPIKIICDSKILRMHNNPKLKAYPWRNRFHRGYPEEVVETWLNDVKEK
ncbi:MULTISPECIES: acyltransferase [Shewanella]|uniref:N-acetyltransferase n=1 Tax=Shewanella xiamenensis TaxID=332186 RepID=A0ABT6U9S8_9GAMM|nr:MULTISPECIES: acyltransferase [Shewanella]MCH7422829.1 N-acetyltransferase [Shewanella sp. MM_2022_3]MDI5831230.1 N-acetyltransferase [Shewanella xiamenensis]UML95034.1 N-acetyltransferase [Shewanella xiamenensis]